MANSGEMTAVVADLLTEYYGERVYAGEPVLLKEGTRCSVVRLSISARSGFTRSVIAKHIHSNHPCGFSDHAAIQFLTRISASKGLAPSFLAGDVARQVLIMEDLGGSKTLADILGGADRGQAIQTLNLLTTQSARLAIAGHAGEADWNQLRNAFPGAAETGRQVEAERWREALPQALAWFEAAGVRVFQECHDCLRSVLTEFAEPGELLAFTHGDPAPTNNHIADNGDLRLLDFEYAAYRHLLYDLSAWDVLCPLPQAVVTGMVESFRATATPAFPLLADETIFRTAYAKICAYRAVAVLSWIPIKALETNQAWADERWTERHGVLAAVDRLVLTTRSTPELAPLTDIGAQLSTYLSRRWPEITTRHTEWRALSMME